MFQLSSSSFCACFARSPLPANTTLNAHVYTALLNTTIHSLFFVTTLTAAVSFTFVF